ncbi:MAG: hypothetical protein IPJ85_08690 [Flavobacteriales bacterium]|nr:hypothetical protein [Flavobacteriales bacterium]
MAAPTTPAPVTISSCTFQSEYNTVTGIVAGQTYSIGSSCGGYITVRRTTFNGVVVANGNAPLTFTAPVAGTYFLHFNTNAGCGTASNCCTTTITCTSCTITPPADAYTAINIPSLPVTGQAVVCHGSNLITAAYVTSLCGTASTLYLGGFEALYTVTPTTTGSYAINYGGQTWSSIWVFSGACPAAGGICEGSVSSSVASQALVVNMTAGVQYWIMFDTFPTPNSPCPGTFSIVNVPPPVVASDCNQAVNVCTNINFQIDPNGSGSVYEIPPLGSLGNPDFIPDGFHKPLGQRQLGLLARRRAQQHLDDRERAHRRLIDLHLRWLRHADRLLRLDHVPVQCIGVQPGGSEPTSACALQLERCLFWWHWLGSPPSCGRRCDEFRAAPYSSRANAMADLLQQLELGNHGGAAAIRRHSGGKLLASSSGTARLRGGRQYVPCGFGMAHRF